MFRRDRNKHGCGIMFSINTNILCKTVNTENFPDDCEVTLIELSIKSSKWLCIAYKALQNMKNISLKIYHLLWLKCLVNRGWLAISTLPLRTNIWKLLWKHWFRMLNQKFYLLLLYQSKFHWLNFNK